MASLIHDKLKYTPPPKKKKKKNLVVLSPDRYEKFSVKIHINFCIIHKTGTFLTFAYE